LAHLMPAKPITNIAPTTANTTATTIPSGPYSQYMNRTPIPGMGQVSTTPAQSQSLAPLSNLKNRFKGSMNPPVIQTPYQPTPTIITSLATPSLVTQIQTTKTQ
jgi:hypothetical protein